MKITIMTLFKEAVETMLDYSIMGRARKNHLLELEAVDMRDYTENKHHKVDDYPYGGGAGMLMMVQPVYDCYKAIAKESLAKKPRVIYVTPQGKVWNQKMAEEFSKEEHLVILCGHYEGIDQRAIDEIVTDEVSIGDYVLTGGELPALIIADSVARLIPGVLGKQESYEDESFSDGLLEYPQYTRPPIFNDREVPEVLRGGDHAKIAEFRRQQSLINTFNKRPDLLEKAVLTEKEKQFIANYAKKYCKDS